METIKKYWVWFLAGAILLIGGIVLWANWKKIVPPNADDIIQKDSNNKPLPVDQAMVTKMVNHTYIEANSFTPFDRELLGMIAALNGQSLRYMADKYFDSYSVKLYTVIDDLIAPDTDDDEKIMSNLKILGRY